MKLFEIIEIEKHVPCNKQWMGRPAAERRAIARCYVAKAVLRYPHTRILLHELQARPHLRLICGFAKRKDIPSESTFSRAFAAFAVTNLGGTVHDGLVTEYLSGELVGHVSRDSTAIAGREKAAKKKPSSRHARRVDLPRENNENRLN